MREPVLLGPTAFLHPGIHGNLIGSPPGDVTYVQSDALHHICLAPGTRDLFARQNLLEEVSFGRGEWPVHSTRWPVLDSAGWVADLDCVQHALFCGVFGVSSEFRERECRRATRSAHFAAATRTRALAILAAYAHPSCKALLVHSHAERRNLVRCCESLAHSELSDAVLAKTKVIYPSAAPVEEGRVQAKWADGQPLQILFCGRGYEAKRGAWALGAFDEALTRYSDVTCVFIGDAPQDLVEDLRRRHSPRFEYCESVPRSEVLAKAAASHILFHPAENESLGVVILEAIASGMAVLAAVGHGMEHMVEWFDPHAHALIDRRACPTAAQEERAFVQKLLELIGDRSQARQLGLANHHTARAGVLSLPARNSVLASAYEMCRRSPSVPRQGIKSNTLRLSSGQLGLLLAAAYRRYGLPFQRDVNFEPLEAA